jgi:hypothetical protein
MTLAALPPTSRYANVETTEHTTPQGETVRHFRRRFIPPVERFQTIAEHTVIEGERPDTLAAQALGDPEQSWRLADANGVMRPEEMTDTPGTVVRITLPEGMVGAPGA